MESSLRRFAVRSAAIMLLPGALLVGSLVAGHQGTVPTAEGPRTPAAVRMISWSPDDLPARIELAPHQMAGFVLRDNGSTGYQWEFSVDPPGTDVVIVDGSVGIANPAPLPGSAGLRILALTGSARGDAVVTAALRRPWEPEPLEVHTVEVTVR